MKKIKYKSNSKHKCNSFRLDNKEIVKYKDVTIGSFLCKSWCQYNDGYTHDNIIYCKSDETREDDVPTRHLIVEKEIVYLPYKTLWTN